MDGGVLTGTILLTTAAVLGGGELSGTRLSPADLPPGGPVRPVTVAATGGADRSPSSGRVSTVPPAHLTRSADPPDTHVPGTPRREPSGTPSAAPSRTVPSRTRTLAEPERARRTLPGTPPEQAASRGPDKSARPPGTAHPSRSAPPQATPEAPRPTKGGPPSGHTPPGRTRQRDPRDDGPGAVRSPEAHNREGQPRLP
jgi:hypothetical protein